MANRLKALTAAVLAVMLVLLCGCGKKGGGVLSSSPGGAGGSSSAPGSPDGETDGDETDGGTGGEEEPGGDGSDDGGNLPADDGELADDMVDDGEEEEEISEYAEYLADEYTYRDIILNRKDINGKFAVFFFRSGCSNEGDFIRGGDCTLLVAPDGTTMVIDCTTRGNVAYIIDSLKKLGITAVDYFVSTHFHNDHCDGYKEFFDNIKVGEFWWTGADYYETSGGSGTGMLKMVRKLGIPERVLDWESEPLKFGPATVECVWPDKGHDWAADQAKINNGGDANIIENSSSLSLKFTWKKASFFFGGDISYDAEEAIVARYGSKIQCDIVKMNHHGCDQQNKLPWINAVKPLVAVAMQSDLHDENVFMRYVNCGVVAMHSTIDGTVRITTSGDGTYDVQSEHDRGEDNYFNEYLHAVKGHFQIKAK